MPTNTVAADSPGEIRRSHDLLQAVTRALEILGSARDPTAALTESFEHATRAFGAEKALLLRVRHGDPPELESIRAQGLEFEQVVACVKGRSVEGVSASRIRRAIDTLEVQLVENSQFDGTHAAETASLRGRPHSVLCAPASPATLRAYSMIASCMPRQMPR